MAWYYPSMNKRYQNRWLRVARLAITLAMLALLVPLFAAPEFAQTLARVNLPLVGLALVLSVLSVASKAWRWGVVLAWRGIHLSPSYLLFSYFISMFFNNFLPSGMGGDVVRAYESAKHTGHGVQSVGAVVVERGSGMLAVFAAGSLGALLVPSLPLGVAFLAHGLFLSACLMIFILWSDWAGHQLRAFGQRLPRGQRLWGKIIHVHDEFRIYRQQRRLLMTVMGQSLITLTLTLASVYCLLLAFAVPAPFGAFAAAFSIVTAIDIIPISLNGLGVREGGYVFFLGLAGVPSAVALGVALLVRLLVLVQALIGGLAYLWRGLKPHQVS
jgi:glycosyltransferase 2 family protein